jgi:type IV pilus assembly protein PilE
MKGNRGFTLIELMIVVAIVAILAAVAVPAYTSYVLRGKLTEAFSELSGMRVRLEQYYQDNRSYGSTAAQCGLGATYTVKYFTYSCTWGAGGTPQFFTATATGIAAQGTGLFVYTIDQSNAKQTTGVPTGWNAPNPNNCWATKPGGTC